MKPALSSAVKNFLAEIGSIGGRSKSPRKMHAVIENAKKARRAKARKYKARKLSAANVKKVG